MKLYRLRIVIHVPYNTGEGKYLGEVPALPGCRAWGDTPAETIENLQSVAGAFIESYRSKGDPLPEEVEDDSAESAGSLVMGEVLVAV